MASGTYRIDDTVVKTANAVQSWKETTYFNGNNHISNVTGSQWAHQTLYKTRRGRYWVEHWSQWQGSTSYAEWVSGHEAARWLLVCGYEIPEDLAQFADEVCE